MPPWASAAGRYMPSDVPLDGGHQFYYFFYQQGCPAVQTAFATMPPSNGIPECTRPRLSTPKFCMPSALARLYEPRHSVCKVHSPVSNIPEILYAHYTRTCLINPEILYAKYTRTCLSTPEDLTAKYTRTRLSTLKCCVQITFACVPSRL